MFLRPGATIRDSACTPLLRGEGSGEILKYRKGLFFIAADHESGHSGSNECSLTAPCADYGLTGNSKRFNWFRWQVEHSWCSALSRRGRNGILSWARMDAVFRQFPLPTARDMRSIYIT